MSETHAGQLLDAVTSVRIRRENDPGVTTDWHRYVYNGNAAKLLQWIHKSTTGRFYFTFGEVAFEDERDALVFKIGFNDAGRN